MRADASPLDQTILSSAEPSELGARLATLLDAESKAQFLHDFEAGGEHMPAALARLAESVEARRQAESKLLAERTFQLGLVLEILRKRDHAAAQQSEWDFATELQLMGLPQDFPPYPDRTDFDIYAGMVTAKEVGGDLYDFFLLGPDRFGFIVGDAAGKGLRAAIFITLTRTLLRAVAERHDDPGECMRLVNEMLCIENPDMMFTTAFFGVLDTRTGAVAFANAGHDAPYLLRTDEKVEPLICQGGMALGIMEGGSYRTGRIELAPGEAIVCFSDGVTEAVDHRGTLFGKARVVTTLAGKSGRHPMELVGEVVGEVDRFIGMTPVADDITVLAVRYNGRSA